MNKLLFVVFVLLMFGVGCWVGNTYTKYIAPEDRTINDVLTYIKECKSVGYKLNVGVNIGDESQLPTGYIIEKRKSSVYLPDEVSFVANDMDGDYFCIFYMQVDSTLYK